MANLSFICLLLRFFSCALLLCGFSFYPLNLVRYLQVGSGIFNNFGDFSVVISLTTTFPFLYYSETPICFMLDLSYSPCLLTYLLKNKWTRKYNHLLFNLLLSFNFSILCFLFTILFVLCVICSVVLYSLWLLLGKSQPVWPKSWTLASGSSSPSVL